MIRRGPQESQTSVRLRKRTYKLAIATEPLLHETAKPESEPSRTNQIIAFTASRRRGKNFGPSGATVTEIYVPTQILPTCLSQLYLFA